MMTIEKFDSIFNHHVRWAIRRMSDDNLEFFKDTRDDWIQCLLALDKFEDDLFKNYLDEGSNNFKMSSEDWSELCHKYMSVDNKTVKYFFFEFWQDGRREFSDYDDLSIPLYADATKEEIEFAREHFSHVVDNERKLDSEWHEHHHTFSDNARVLVYRKHRFIIDNEWQDAWAIKDGKVISFRLMWDWYYPIDDYLDL